MVKKKQSSSKYTYLFICLFIYLFSLPLPSSLFFYLFNIHFLFSIYSFIYLFVYSLSPSYKKRHWQDSNLRSRWKLLSRQPPWPLGHNVLYNLGRLHGIKNNQSPRQSKISQLGYICRKFCRVFSSFLIFYLLSLFVYSVSFIQYPFIGGHNISLLTKYALPLFM